MAFFGKGFILRATKYLASIVYTPTKSKNFNEYIFKPIYFEKIFQFFSLIGGSDYKLIYRHYATLYFVFCVDSSESELGILDLIQVFVETLDKCFENVCELDLIFHMDKVHYILNELVMGGMVLETNMTEILTRVEEQNKIEKEEVCP